MRGQIGYLLADIERMKREGKLPSDYNPFPPRAVLAIIAASAVLVALIYYGVTFVSYLLR